MEGNNGPGGTDPMGELAPGQCVILLAPDGQNAILRYRQELSIDPNGEAIQIPADQLLIVAAQIILLRAQLQTSQAAMPGSGRILRLS